MTYKRFEDLPVWKEAIALAEKVYALTEDPTFARQRSLQDQLERAAVSVSNNIAEGFERGTTQELLAFIYIARGSAGEVRSMLCLIERLPRFAHLNLIFQILRRWQNPVRGSYGHGQRACRSRPSKDKGD